MTEVSGVNLAQLLLHLQRIFDRFEGSKRDRVELPIHLLDLAHVHVLHDLARVGINRKIGPRGLSHFMPFIALDQSVAFSLAAGLLERFGDEVHAVIAAERDEFCCMGLAFSKAATYSLFI